MTAVLWVLAAFGAFCLVCLICSVVTTRKQDALADGLVHMDACPRCGERGVKGLGRNDGSYRLVCWKCRITFVPDVSIEAREDSVEEYDDASDG